MSFVNKLKKASEKNRTLLCIGLDTDIEKLPYVLKRTADSLCKFNQSIIEATHDLVCAYKINTAFYEAIGPKGFEILISTIKSIPDDIPIIIDAKRADISSTNEMYAKSLFIELKADAITVNPYFGVEAIEPFLKFEDKFTFVVVLTTNKGAYDFQYLKCADKFLFQHVAEKFLSLNYKNIGFVVGATKGEDMNLIRQMSDETLFLIPGVGEQKGNLEIAIKYGINKDKIALINVSRSIIYASNSEDYAKKAREKAIEFKEKINKILEIQ